MSNIAAGTSLFLASQAQARQQTMAAVAVKQEAQQGQAIADMLAAAAQAAQPAIAPPGQGQAIDIRV
jgi:hypothetical protein